MKASAFLQLYMCLLRIVTSHVKGKDSDQKASNRDIYASLADIFDIDTEDTMIAMIGPEPIKYHMLYMLKRLLLSWQK